MLELEQEHGPGGWDWDKKVTNFTVVADSLEKEGQFSRADVVRYLIARVLRAEAAE